MKKDHDLRQQSVMKASTAVQSVGLSNHMCIPMFLRGVMVGEAFSDEFPPGVPVRGCCFFSLHEHLPSPAIKFHFKNRRCGALSRVLGGK